MPPPQRHISVTSASHQHYISVTSAILCLVTSLQQKRYLQSEDPPSLRSVSQPAPECACDAIRAIMLDKVSCAGQGQNRHLVVYPFPDVVQARR